MDPMTLTDTLRLEAARVGISPAEYADRLEQGLLFCSRCEDWHQAGAFPADARRHTGRAASCAQSIRAEVRAGIATRALTAVRRLVR